MAGDWGPGTRKEGYGGGGPVTKGHSQGMWMQKAGGLAGTAELQPWGIRTPVR